MHAQPREQPAIDSVVRARDEAGLIGGEERDEPSHFLGFADAPDGMGRTEPLKDTLDIRIVTIEGAGRELQDVMVSDDFGFPAAMQWKGVSDLVTTMVGGEGGALLKSSAKISMIIAAGAGIILEVWRTMSRNRMWLSPLAIGLGVVVPPDSTIAMFAGAATG